MYFDTHVHFDGLGGLDEAELAIERAREGRVSGMVAVGGSAEVNRLALELADRFAGEIASAVGLDRDQTVADPVPVVDELRGVIAESTCHGVMPCAIGEIGLDYHYSADTADLQVLLVETQLELARDLRLPVIFHSREADEQTLALLRAHAEVWKGDQGRIGVLHCFTRSLELARQVIELGFHLSFSGIITFKNAEELRHVAAWVPADRLLVETDTPYLAPVPYRGQRNEPAYVVEVVKCLADARGVSAEAAADITTKNAKKLFALDTNGA